MWLEMLSLGEVHNMGLNGRGGGFRHSGDYNVYDRGNYGLSTLLDGAAAGNAGGLQHHLTDFLHQNPFLQTSLPPVASALTTYSSMGFPGCTQGGESLLFDVEVMPQVDDQFNFPAGIVTTTAPVPTFDSIASLGLGGPSVLQQQQRESWVGAAAAATAPVRVGVKREAPVLDQANMQPRKKVETSARVVVGLDKCKRPSDQADHILRERQRRDDMTSKFAVLESLLPTGPKRDRSTIVDDSIEYVKNLHHRIKSLQKRKEALAQASANPLAKGNTANGTACWKWPKAEVLQQQQPALASPEKPKVKPPKSPVSPEEMSRIRAALRTSLESIQVHTDMPNQIVINMVCRPQPRLQSNVLVCLESLDLDVMQCSITKVSQRLICVITARPQEESTPASGIVAALKYAMGSDICAD